MADLQLVLQALLKEIVFESVFAYTFSWAVQDGISMKCEGHAVVGSLQCEKRIKGCNFGEAQGAARQLGFGML